MSDSRKSAGFRLLEGATAVVLLLVLATLLWMVAAAYLPGWAAWARAEVQVVAVVVLLVSALLLVSAVALWHTRA
jgi:hypothetical protein